MLLAERLDEWFENRKQKQIAKAVAEAREEAEAKMREEVTALWQAWNERRLEAERLGQPFDEPPPSI